MHHSLRSLSNFQNNFQRPGPFYLPTSVR
jgi:hypothetical protein